MRPLTKRQREIVDFLAEHIRTKGFAPSLAEIGERFQLTSIATVFKHLRNLEDKGYIRRRWNIPRSIELVAATDCCPTCGRKYVSEPAEVA